MLLLSLWVIILAVGIPIVMHLAAGQKEIGRAHV